MTPIGTIEENSAYFSCTVELRCQHVFSRALTARCAVEHAFVIANLLHSRGELNAAQVEKRASVQYFGLCLCAAFVQRLKTGFLLKLCRTTGC
jgi:hypothetical protein